MEQQPGAFEGIHAFLEDVAEQIQYKPIREEIKVELAAHIEDRKAEYMEQGMEASKAERNAVEDMGNAVEVGAQLNEVRSLQKNQPAVLLVMALVAIGILGNVRLMLAEQSGLRLFSFFYFVFGIASFTILYLDGYHKLIKNIKKMNTIILSTWFLYLLINLVQRKTGNALLFKFTGISMIFALQLLSIPTIVSMVYSNRSKKYKPFLLVTALLSSMIYIATQVVDEYILAANLIQIITVYAALIYMIGSRMLAGKQKQQIFSWILSLGVVTAVFIITFSGNWKYEVEQFIYPERVVKDNWDDSYNSILVKDLLGKAELVGSISLSQDELMAYYTDEWYFDNLDDFHYKYKMQFVDEATITLEDILPQHYQNNYRIAYWILKYGWLPAIFLLSIIGATYIVLMKMAGRITNKMGKVLAFSCLAALILQFVFYFLGNIGYQFAWFCNFPFISEGVCSITTNMILAGLACSAYRYDRVIKEEREKGYVDRCI